MKTLITILLLFNATSIVPEKTNSKNDIRKTDLVFQELDKKLMKLWLNGKNQVFQNLESRLASSIKEWKFVKSELNKSELSHINIPEFIKDVDYFFELLIVSSELEDYKNIERMSYHILYEFRNLRQCYFYSSYPLDKLWDVIDVYYNIDFTIDDPMMNLKEWFEFEDMINEMICDWENYDHLHISEIQNYFPGINAERHNVIKEDVDSCTFSLLISIETAQQDKFKMPCDQLGNALEELIQLYAYSQTLGLM